MLSRLCMYMYMHVCMHVFVHSKKTCKQCPDAWNGAYALIKQKTVMKMINKCIHAYKRTSIHANACTFIHANTRTFMHANTRTYKRSYVHTYKKEFKYKHSYVHTYQPVCVHTPKRAYTYTQTRILIHTNRCCSNEPHSQELDDDILNPGHTVVKRKPPGTRKPKKAPAKQLEKRAPSSPGQAVSTVQYNFRISGSR